MLWCVLSLGQQMWPGFVLKCDRCVVVIPLSTQPLARGPVPHTWDHSRYFPKAPKPQFRPPPAVSSVTVESTVEAKMKCFRERQHAAEA